MVLPLHSEWISTMQCVGGMGASGAAHTVACSGQLRGKAGTSAWGKKAGARPMGV